MSEAQPRLERARRRQLPPRVRREVEDPQVTEKHTWPERLPYTTQQVLSPSTCITTAEWSKRGGGDTSEPSATDCHVSVTRSTGR